MRFSSTLDEETGNQTLHVTKNPTLKERAIILVKKVLVSYIYWNYDQQKALFFGDDRHGSEINPQQQWVEQTSEFAKRLADGGLTFYDYVINGNGSSDDHVATKINPGKFWHSDFLISVPGISEFKVLAWQGLNPRFYDTGLPVIINGKICFNQGGNLYPADSGKYVMYHIFATNDKIANHHIISISGRNQYDSLADAWAGNDSELQTLHEDLPQSALCFIGTLFYEVDDSFSNSAKARLVSINDGGQKSHPPVTIADDSKQYLSITEKQELSFTPGATVVVQPNHGFTGQHPIRFDGEKWVKAQGDSVFNANTMGFVASVIDANTFTLARDGHRIEGAWIGGEEYFLSATTAGEAILEPEYEIGQVRQSLGWSDADGWLYIEIDIGDEIYELPVIQGFQGAQGNPGQDGTSVRIVGSVPTPGNLPPGADEIGDGYIAQDTGHLWVWDGAGFNDVGLVRGPQGEQGSQGVQGYQGVQGDRGYQGSQGNQGQIGAQGVQGAQGEIGVQGVQGARGFQGYPGTRGSLWGSGTIDPTGGLGKLPHDMYINRSTGDLFEFSSSYWIKIMNLIGDPGPQGPQGFPGVGTQGPQGKTGAASTVPGPQGPQGEIGVASTVPGPQGPQGMPGTSEWTDAGSFIYPTESDDRVVIGANLYDNINDILQIFGSTLFKVTDDQAIKIQESADGNPVITVFDGSMFHESIEFINEDKAVLVKRYLGLKQQFTPNNPPEGGSYIWQDISGNIKIKITEGSVTKTATLIDFSNL